MRAHDETSSASFGVPRWACWGLLVGVLTVAAGVARVALLDGKGRDFFILCREADAALFLVRPSSGSLWGLILFPGVIWVTGATAVVRVAKWLAGRIRPGVAWKTTVLALTGLAGTWAVELMVVLLAGGRHCGLRTPTSEWLSFAMIVAAAALIASPVGVIATTLVAVGVSSRRTDSAKNSEMAGC